MSSAWSGLWTAAAARDRRSSNTGGRAPRLAKDADMTEATWIDDGVAVAVAASVPHASASPTTAVFGILNVTLQQ